MYIKHSVQAAWVLGSFWAVPCPSEQGWGNAAADVLVLALMMLLLQFLMAGWLTGYTWRCDPVDFSQDPKALRVSSLPSPDKYQGSRITATCLCSEAADSVPGC